MTSQPPTGFENYPFQGERDGISDPEPASPAAVTPYQAPTAGPPPQPSRGLGRRGLLGLIIGVPVAGVLGSVVFRAGGGEAGAEATASATEWIDDDYDSGDYLDVGGQYSAQIREGWESVTPDGDEAIVARGSSRVLALAVMHDGSQEVADQLIDLVEEYRGRFKGSLAEPLDTSSSDVRRATVTASGSVGGDAARLRADLWIDDEDNGLLVIQTLTARKGSKVAADAQAMADELSAGF